MKVKVMVTLELMMIRMLKQAGTTTSTIKTPNDGVGRKINYYTPAF